MRAGFKKQVCGLALIACAICFFRLDAAVSQAAEWTFMVYIGGDNNLSEAAVYDIEEMRRATTGGAAVNVIVQVELSSYYSFNLPQYIPDYGTHRLQIVNGQVFSLQNLGNLDMGNPATLRDFIQWGASSFPAAKYALTIWDHGSGWRNAIQPESAFKGAVQDETSGSFMSLQQLGQAVRESGIHLDLLDFDACLMGMYEVAYEFIGLVDFMVFSEEVEPGDGNPYTPILNALAANPAMGPSELAGVIVDQFVASYQGTRQSATKSAVDMSRMPELHERLVQLAGQLRSGLAVSAPAVASARVQAQNYVEAGNIDIVSLCNRLSGIGGEIGAAASRLADFVGTSVVTANSFLSSTNTVGGGLGSGNVEDSHGIAVFFPSLDILRQGEFSEYASLSCNAAGDGWSAFLGDFLDGTGGGGSTTGSVAMTAGGFAYGLVWLDQFGYLGYTDLDLYVVEPGGTIGSPWIGESTPNGYFSPDSYDTLTGYEIYGAKDTVMSGEYLVIVNYYDDYYDPRQGYYEQNADVFLAFMDPLQGLSQWTIVGGPNHMGLWNPAPYWWTDDVIRGILWGWYSDWWFPTSTIRNLRAMTFERQKEILLQVKSRAEASRGKNLQNNLQNLFDYYRSEG